ncbi:MAG: prolipoprotein diacylglyceryl transferase, partial [Planctomycetaceae bacterium]|nr:prolipoprotein diacylglyceryl transferase [Planctomycetaceae bacterium]
GVFGAAIVLAPKVTSLIPSFGKATNSIPVFGYGLMMCLGFVFGTMLASRRASRAGFPPETIWDLTFLFLVSGVGGARLYYLIQHGDRVFAKCETAGEYLVAAIWLPDGGLVFYGGLIAGAGVFWRFCHTRKLDAWKLGDLIVPSIFLGMAFGRFGCFLYGCCFGDRCELPWAVEFPIESVPFKAQMQRGFLPADATASLPIHPTQLYSVIDGVLLCLLTLAYYPIRARDGSVVTLALLTYPVSRFFIERLRGDEMGMFGSLLTSAQWISLTMLAGGIALATLRAPLLKRSTRAT